MSNIANLSWEGRGGVGQKVGGGYKVKGGINRRGGEAYQYRVRMFNPDKKKKVMGGA